MRQVILDTETTGLELELGHRIIEIGCLELINRKLTGKHFHQYINPEREVEKEALLVHGINDDFLKTKPIFSDIAHELMEFIEGAELIIHNAPFDISFINHELNLTKKKWKPISHYCRITDTLVMARQKHVGQRNSLDALCKRYSVDNSSRDFHGALLDAKILAEVYLAMTGGQSSLFDETIVSDANQAVSSNAQRKIFNNRNLVILYAREEELIAHEEKLQIMAEKGKCVWLEE